MLAMLFASIPGPILGKILVIAAGYIFLIFVCVYVIAGTLALVNYESRDVDPRERARSVTLGHTGIWSLDSGGVEEEWTEATGPTFQALALHPSGRQAALATAGAVSIWDASSGRKLNERGLGDSSAAGEKPSLRRASR